MCRCINCGCQLPEGKMVCHFCETTNKPIFHDILQANTYARDFMGLKDYWLHYVDEKGWIVYENNKF